MNAGEFFERAARLERARTPYAIAMVVERRAPVSAHLGDRALVFPDGRIQGFVGGACTRDIVRRHALEAIARGSPRLVQIRPGANPDPEPSAFGEAILVPMGCASEGAVDVYIEPHLPARTLLVAGLTPVAEALARLTAALDGYRVVRVVAAAERGELRNGEAEHAIVLDELPSFLAALDPIERSALVCVVASQGHYDEAALEALLAVAPAYTGLLASRRRAAGVFGALEQRSVGPERIAKVRNPAGLDIGARRPTDVAISILAEIVATLEAQPQGEAVEVPSQLAVDAVCGMDVDPAGAQHRTEFKGTAYYFCCSGCHAAFAAEPARYARPVHA